MANRTNDDAILHQWMSKRKVSAKTGSLTWGEVAEMTREELAVQFPTVDDCCMMIQAYEKAAEEKAQLDAQFAKETARALEILNEPGMRQVKQNILDGKLDIPELGFRFADTLWPE